MRQARARRVSSSSSYREEGVGGLSSTAAPGGDVVGEGEQDVGKELHREEAVDGEEARWAGLIYVGGGELGARDGVAGVVEPVDGSVGEEMC